MHVDIGPNIDVHELVGSMSVAWLELFLDGEEEYREMLFGDMPSEVTQQLSRFEYHKERVMKLN